VVPADLLDLAQFRKDTDLMDRIVQFLDHRELILQLVVVVEHRILHFLLVEVAMNLLGGVPVVVEVEQLEELDQYQDLFLLFLEEVEYLVKDFPEVQGQGLRRLVEFFSLEQVVVPTNLPDQDPVFIVQVEE
jgi:hypothetical protein